MRITLPLGQQGVALVAAAGAVVALCPLRVALDIAQVPPQVLTARQVDGSLWLGRLRDARLMRASLGDAVASLSFWQLLLGNLHIRVRAERLQGALLVSRTGFGVDDVSGTLPGFALAPGIVIEPLGLRRLSLLFAQGRCSRASGVVRVELRPSELLPSPIELTGHARCDKTALVVPLVADRDRGRLDVRISHDRRYQLRLLITGAQAGKLRVAGFRPGPGGLALTVEGRL